MLCQGDWWGVSMPSMKGGLRTWISNGLGFRVPWKRRGIVLELSFFSCLLVGVFCCRVY
jgi:hypothetical protein